MTNGQPGDRGEAEVESVDLTNCEREPIHQLGRVQAFGFLLGCTPDWTVSHASENIEAFAGISARDAIGRNLADILGDEAVHTVRNRLQYLRGQDGVERVRDLKLDKGDQHYGAFVHVSGETIVLEIEPSPEETDLEEDVNVVRSIMSRLANVGEVPEFCRAAAKYLHALIRFDRVMVYKFLDDDCGEVIAETKLRNLEPFLNLRYPASDIPKQARALYLKNPMRIISDASDRGTPIVSQSTGHDTGLDLSLSTLRSVSPIHLEYLSHMGVAASMSVSIIVNNRLWGLFACHHGEPIVLDQAKRSAVDLFGQMFSLLLTGKLAAEETGADDRVRELTHALTGSDVCDRTPTERIVPVLREFASVIAADGFGARLDGATILEGKTPTADEFGNIVDYLNGATTDRVFASHELRTIIPQASDFVQRAAGMLAIPISRSPRDYIIFFRQEVIKAVQWAGNPDKPVTVGPDSMRLTPRKSFEAWQSTVEGQSEHWSSSELRSASLLRIALLEIVLRLSDAAGKERDVAQRRQELLIAELNHRVRNILGLVKGIISQSVSESLSTADYVQKLDSRIQALARAHDQITRQNWTASSLHDLVMTEAQSYLLDNSERIEFKGKDYLLDPEAFSSMALVVHELVTNAAKYGALSTGHGRISVTTGLDEDGGLRIGWREIGGPAVVAPSRRGFGSTIIERTVPYQLKGKASAEYHLSGLEARYEIPASYVKPATQSNSGPGIAMADAKAVPGKVPNSVLIVEDNLIIGLEAEKLFDELGVRHIEVAANLDQARQLLDGAHFDFAMLDVNLGTHTSFSLAETLIGKGIKMAFATGYGDMTAFPEAVVSIPRIAKPFDRDAIVRVLNAV